MKSFIITEILCIFVLSILFVSQSAQSEYVDSTNANLQTKSPDFEQNKSSLSVSCNDPQQTDQGYDADAIAKRIEIEKIVLADTAIQKIIDGNTCEFMAIGTVSGKNGPYQTLNINLNGTEDLAVKVSLQNKSVVSYELTKLGRSTTSHTNSSGYILQYVYVAVAVGIIAALILIWKKRTK